MNGYEKYRDYIPEVRFMLLPAKVLRSDLPYQRSCSKYFVKRLVKEFDKNCIRVCRVSEREDEEGNLAYYVFDGQHTVEALKAASGSDDCPVYCMIYSGLTYGEEARLFYLQKKLERALVNYDIINAKIESGDEKAIEIQRIANSYGFELGSKVSDNVISATKNLEKIYFDMGAEVLGRVLMLISDCWYGRKEYLKSSLISALAKVIYIYGEEIDDEKFMAKFETVSMRELLLEAKGFSDRGANWSRAIVSIYNKNNRRKLDVEKLLDN